MSVLEIFVCENAAVDFTGIIKREYEDVKIVPYPCLCLCKGRVEQLRELLADHAGNENDRILLCNRRCNVMKLESGLLRHFRLEIADYCFEQLISSELLQFITDKGGYVVTSGWLQNWRQKLDAAGFDEATARAFYHDFCTELVYLDTAVKEAGEELERLSTYLDIPVRRLNIDTAYAASYLRNLILEWRLQKNNENFSRRSAELKRQNAEYAALIHIMTRISSSRQKREVIEAMKEIFTTLFGAEKFVYSENIEVLPSEFAGAAALLEDERAEHLLLESEGKIIVKLFSGQTLNGLLMAGDFMLPQYLPRYAAFAVSVARVAGVVLQNARHIEMLEENKDLLRYLSYHDGLTKLYNRAYFNEVLESFKTVECWAAFICDLDNLKIINDQYGHDEGDKAICLTAELLRGCFRETDVVARLGGDEFAVLVPDCDEAQAEILKRRLEDEFKKQELVPRAWPYGVSVGVATSQCRMSAPEEVIKLADARMYEVKRRRKAAKAR